MTNAERIKAWRYEKGVSKRPQLTMGEIETIKQLKQDGYTLQKIATMMNRSIDCIGKVCRKKNI